MKILRKILITVSFLLYALGNIIIASGEEEISDVYVIELHGEVNDAMVSYLERELETAYQNDQIAVIDIDTYGGLLDSAAQISEILLNTPVETCAFVSGKAISAGVLITVSCDSVAMKPSSYLGAAEVIPYSEKVLSMWKGMLSTAAVENNRPEQVILAMADSRIVIDGYSKDGELLTLSARQAADLDVADALCDDIPQVIEHFDLGKTYTIAVYSLSDKTAAMLTSTVALTVLFTLGFVFMVIEVFTAGFGVAGIISIACFALYFFGGVIAGTTEWWAIGLFVMGIIFLIIEIFVPGFGVFGIAGIIMCILALIFSSDSLNQFIRNAGIAMLVSGALIPIFIKIFGKANLFDRVANTQVQSVDEGYVINHISDDTIGQQAVAVTDLRPIGIVEADGKRLDAFSEEGFIQEGTAVMITGKKSSSVVVRKERK